MQVRYAEIGGAAAVGIGRRWLIALLAFLLGATLAAVTASPVRAQTVPLNAVYYDHEGTINVPTSPGNAAAIASAVNMTDGAFIQMDVGSEIFMTFGDSAAVGDGTEAADLRIVVVDDLFPAFAEVYLQGSGTDGFEFHGLFADTSDILIDLDAAELGPITEVRIVQNEFCPVIEGEPIPCVDQTYPNLGFDLDAVEALSLDDGEDEGITCGGDPDPCANIADPEGQWTASCEDCDGATITVNEEGEGEIANIDVEDTPPDGFTFELISNDRPTRWWKAFVEADGVRVANCTLRQIARWVLREERPATGCFYLTPLFGNRLRYTVLWPTDPGFSFR
jgi:hypothetical protein